MHLRRLREADLGRMFHIRNNPAVYDWCRQWAPLHWDNHLAWYHAQAKDRSLEMFAMEDASTNFVGVCGLTSIDHVNSRAEFSLYIDPEHHKKGLGHKALLELFKIGFFKLNLNRIWGETFDGNPALKLFKKLGMQIEGIRKEFYYRDGNYIDCYLISMSRREFRAHLSGEQDKAERDFIARCPTTGIPVF
jgi:RimJ/RimL family protein N-acetyltransferase